MKLEALESRQLMSLVAPLTVNGTPGADVIYLSANSSGALVVQKNGVATTYSGRVVYSKVVVNGLAGNDTIRAIGTLPRPVEIYGGPGSDKLYGGNGNDFICGASSVYANEPGEDYLDGGAGNDSLFASFFTGSVLKGQFGNDVLRGGASNDRLEGGPGDDRLEAGNGNDYLLGGAGADTLFCGAGHDQAFGDAADDKVYGEAGNDQLDGGQGNDVLDGGDGDDVIHGSYGNDRLDGWGGYDLLFGDDGNDFVFGEDADDRLYGGAGDDQLVGGAGDDILVAVGGGQRDRCFGSSGNDYIWLDGESSETHDASGQEKDWHRVHRVGSFANGVSRDLLGQNLPDPGSAGLSTQTFNGKATPLFATGRTAMTDVNQGNIGDCWLMAPLAATAWMKPNVIRNTVVDFGDGTYGVQFYKPTLAGPKSYVYRVDADLWVNGNTLTFAFGNGSLWVPIVEKAAALFYGGSYADLDHGQPTSAFTALGIESDSVGTAIAPFALASAKGGLDSHEAVVACTRGSSKKTIGKVVTDHCYVVTAVDLAHSTVTVYNPWGVDGTSLDSNPNDGLVKLSATEFAARFYSVVIGDV